LSNQKQQRGAEADSSLSSGMDLMLVMMIHGLKTTPIHSQKSFHHVQPISNDPQLMVCTQFLLELRSQNGHEAQSDEEEEEGTPVLTDPRV
jgi:hypothetical protein